MRSKSDQCKKIKKIIRKNRIAIIFFLAILMFPIFVKLACLIPCLKEIGIASDECLAFYGTAFGIFASFYTYRAEKRKSELQHRRDLMPKISIELQQRRTQRELFDLSIYISEDRPFFDVFLFDEYVFGKVEESEKISISFGLSKEQQDCLKPDVNVSVDEDEIMDTDGYPKYIQIVCHDIENTGWVCNFDKVDCNGKRFYASVGPWSV